MNRLFGNSIFFALCFLSLGLFAKSEEPKLSLSQKEESENLFPKIKDHYRQEADTFLKENRKKKHIVEREGGHLQYETLKEGKGEKISVYQTPIVKISGYYLDNKIFLSPMEKRISLGETLPSLKNVLLEMKVGEKREIYLHPDLSLGRFWSSSSFPSFSQLVRIEIEILSLEKPHDPFEEPLQNQNIR
jgi:FKBP-type peptidyl-prolyl cis-trans isomerase